MYNAKRATTRAKNNDLNMREADQPSSVVEAPECPESLAIKCFSHKTEFGWVFPELSHGEAKNPVVIDSKWMAEYSAEIDALELEIDKQSLLSISDHRQNNFVNETLRTEIKYISAPNYMRRSDNVRENFNSKFKKRSNHQYQNDNVTSKINNETNCNDSGFEEELNTESEVTQISSSVTEMEGKMISQEIRVPRNESVTRSDTPQSEACYSMLSCSSRDSGVYASDDVSEYPPEAHAERSLLEELEEIFYNRETQPETPERCITHKAEFEAAATISDEETGDKCPIWFQKFSGDCSLSLRLSPLAWDPGTIGDEASAKSMNSEVTNKSITSAEDTVSDEAGVDEICENTQQQRQLANLLTTCERLEALSLRSCSERGVAEVIKLAKSFNKINNRLQNLRYSLQGLILQAHENKHDLSTLEVRASGLLSSTSASRRHMTQARALQRLEDRLQEEWWAAYDPNALPLHENYIV